MIFASSARTRLHAEHRPGDQHGELAVRHLQRHRDAAEVRRELGVALEPAALQGFLDLLFDRGDAHQRGRRVAFESRAAQDGGAAVRGRHLRQQRAARRRDVQGNELARLGGVADRVRRLDGVDEQGAGPARRREHGGFAGFLDQHLQQLVELLRDRVRAFDLAHDGRPQRRRVVAAARLRLVEVAARREGAQQVEGARAWPLEVLGDLRQARGPSVGREELDQVQDVGGLFDVHGCGTLAVV